MATFLRVDDDATLSDPSLQGAPLVIFKSPILHRVVGKMKPNSALTVQVLVAGFDFDLENGDQEVGVLCGGLAPKHSRVSFRWSVTVEEFHRGA